MSHDLRQALGYRRLPASDPVEQQLRDEWYRLKAKFETEGQPESGQTTQEFRAAHRRLSDYLWDRAVRQVEADRQKHPKAKRNQPVPPRDTSTPSTRILL